MLEVFADTDVCLDLLTGRQPHNAAAERLFTFADRGNLRIHVSSLTFSHIDYILQSQYKRRDSRMILLRFKTLVNVLAVDEKVIDLALASDVRDFEDAIQYNTAIQHKVQVLLTRNVKDYRKANISISTPEVFVTGIV